MAHEDDRMKTETLSELRRRHKTERTALVMSVVRSSSSMLEAAQRLGIDRGGIYRELREAGIEARCLRQSQRQIEKAEGR
jgi:transcriptional regulator of acetoin/glycerol metabolism